MCRHLKSCTSHLARHLGQKNQENFLYVYLVNSRLLPKRRGQAYIYIQAQAGIDRILERLLSFIYYIRDCPLFTQGYYLCYISTLTGCMCMGSLLIFMSRLHHLAQWQKFCSDRIILRKSARAIIREACFSFFLFQDLLAPMLIKELMKEFSISQHLLCYQVNCVECKTLLVFGIFLENRL